MPVTTSKQAIQANTAPAKDKWMNYKQIKIKPKPLQSTEVFKLVLKDLSIYSILASTQVTSTQVSYVFAMGVSSVETPTKDLGFK